MTPLFRVLQVATSMNVGGLETFLINMYRNIDREKVQFDFLTFRKQEAFYDQEIISLGGNIYRLSPISLSSVKCLVCELNNFFASKHYKIVHSHIDALSTIPLFVAKRNDIPVRIAHSHTAGMSMDYKSVLRVVSRSLLASQATHYCACSEAAAQWLFGGSKVGIKKVNIIPNAINTSGMRFNIDKRKQGRVRNGWEDKFVVGHVGSFTEPKNHKFILDVFMEILCRRPNSLLVLVGDGTLKAQMQSKVKILNIENKVLFLGIRDDIADILAMFDVFLFPSLYEGLPLSLMEAQASGLPCFTSQGRVTQSADVTGLVRFLPLELGASLWAQEVVSSVDANDKRPDTYAQLVDARYDVVSAAKKLERYYHRLYSKYSDR